MYSWGVSKGWQEKEDKKMKKSIKLKGATLSLSFNDYRVSVGFRADGSEFAGIASQSIRLVDLRAAGADLNKLTLKDLKPHLMTCWFEKAGHHGLFGDLSFSRTSETTFNIYKENESGDYKFQYELTARKGASWREIFSLAGI